MTKGTQQNPTGYSSVFFSCLLELEKSEEVLSPMSRKGPETPTAHHILHLVPCGPTVFPTLQRSRSHRHYSWRVILHVGPWQLKISISVSSPEVLQMKGTTRLLKQGCFACMDFVVGFGLTSSYISIALRESLKRLFTAIIIMPHAEVLNMQTYHCLKMSKPEDSGFKALSLKGSGKLCHTEGVHSRSLHLCHGKQWITVLVHWGLEGWMAMQGIQRPEDFGGVNQSLGKGERNQRARNVDECAPRRCLTQCRCRVNIRCANVCMMNASSTRQPSRH
jgi:hypothetical protein